MIKKSVVVLFIVILLSSLVISTSHPVQLGDVTGAESNQNDVVNIVDVIEMINYFLTGSGLSNHGVSAADVNCDEIVNITDILNVINSIISENPLPSCSTTTTTMSFFVGEPSTTGGDLDGLAGADADCQRWGTEAGFGSKTWRAYLSACQTYELDGTCQIVINAKNRIGAGPWYNYNGDSIGDNTDIHTNVGSGISGIQGSDIFDKNGNPIALDATGDPWIGDHDIFTGTDSNGNFVPDATCNDWTSEDDGNFAGWVGHSDVSSGTWNDAGHLSKCNRDGLWETGGVGRIYCFAIN